MHNDLNPSYQEAQSSGCVFDLSVSDVPFRFGLLPLSMSNMRHTKSDRQAVDPVSRVSCRNGLSACVSVRGDSSVLN